MLHRYFHLSDEELLRYADGELSALRVVRARFHLSACWDCRARMATMEGTIADFVRTHREQVDPLLPPISGSRLRLEERLAQLEHSSAAMAAGRPRVPRWAAQLAVAGVLALAAFLAVKWVVKQQATKAYAGLLPDRSLTPGATHPVAIRDLCAMQHDEVVSPVPGRLRQEVFEEYKVRDASAENYEVDYLITPGLGGADDIRNLWPEPRRNAVWNSLAKDQLEDRLHQMVCEDKISLSEAQQEVAGDWISAYKKYFHANAPVGPAPVL